MTSPIGTFRTWRDVCRESAMRTKADMRSLTGRTRLAQSIEEMGY
jgi:hypothetical protein